MKDNSKMGSSDSLLNTIRTILEKEHTVPKSPKEKALAKLAHPKDKITHKDVLVGRGVLKKENSGDRMGVLVGTRKEKVEVDPKLKESEQVDELKASTLKSYSDKADKQVKKIGRKMMRSPDDYDGLDKKDQNTLDKRNRGDDLLHRRKNMDRQAKKLGYKDRSDLFTHGKKGERTLAVHRAKNEEVESVDERELTGAETAKKEKLVLSLKKRMGGFKKRYGERAKEVMYATATKMAKKD